MSDDLLAALDAAPDDAARAALLAGRSPAELEQLQAALVYRQFHVDVGAAVAAELAAKQRFSVELDAAATDEARLRIIEAAQADPQRGPSWVARWKWERTADLAERTRHFVAALGAGAADTIGRVA